MLPKLTQAPKKRLGCYDEKKEVRIQFISQCTSLCISKNNLVHCERRRWPEIKATNTAWSSRPEYSKLFYDYFTNVGPELAKQIHTIKLSMPPLQAIPNSYVVNDIELHSCSYDASCKKIPRDRQNCGHVIKSLKRYFLSLSPATIQLLDRNGNLPSST